MECRDAKEKITAYLDGELDEDMRRAVREHLEKCPDCASEARSMEAAWALMDAATVPEPPDDLPPRIVARATGGSRSPAPAGTVRRGKLFAWPTSALAAVAATVGIFLGVLLGSSYVSDRRAAEVGREAAADYGEYEGLFSEMPEGTLGWAVLETVYEGEENEEPDREDAR